MWFQRYDSRFLQREAAAAAAAWRAIASLPSDLYSEAIQSSSSRAAGAASDAAAAAAAAAGDTAAAAAAAEYESYCMQRFPEELAFHRVYRQQLFDSLTDTEKHKLQIYFNLMHIRYPHADIKQRQPELFWISERQAIGRQKENALKKKKK